MGIALGRNSNGPLANWPLLPSIVMGLLAFEFCQYWQHRISHEARGRIGGWLWRVHVAHHLPDRVYVLMHPAGHPISAPHARYINCKSPIFIFPSRQKPHRHSAMRPAFRREWDGEGKAELLLWRGPAGKARHTGATISALGTKG
jgi:hypothetical protein